MGLITAMVITALPMAGDYYTNQLLSGSPKTTMIGNTIYYYLAAGSQKNVGACLVIQLSVVLLVFMAYYLVLTQRASKEADPMSSLTAVDAANAARGVPDQPEPAASLARPLAQAILPVHPHLAVHPLVARAGGHGRAVLVQRRTVTHPVARILVPLVLERSLFVDSFTDPDLLRATPQHHGPGYPDDLVSVPIGVLLALGLTRWRSTASAASNGVSLVPAGHAGDRARLGLVPGLQRPCTRRSSRSASAPWCSAT